MALNGRNWIWAALAALVLVLMSALATGEPSRDPATHAVASTRTAEVTATPRRVRQRNGLLRTTVRLQGAAGITRLRSRPTPLSEGQRARFRNRLAGVNPAPRGPVTEQDTLVPPLGPPSEPRALPTSSGASARTMGSQARTLAAGDFTVFRNTVVGHGTLDGTATSNVAEPTVANDRNALLYTANWYAKVSADNGLTWQSNIQPSAVFTALPATPALSGGFCCDQTAHAVDHNGESLVFWSMQGLLRNTKNPPGNALVLGVFRGKDDLIDATGVNDFCAYELTAEDFGLPGDNNFDFPQMASSTEHLYISVNVGKGRNKATSFALVMRFDLDDLVDGDCLVDPVAWSDTRTKENLIPVQDPEDEMFFATHTRTADIFKGDQLRIYSIRDNSTEMETKNVNITDFAPQARGMECPTQGRNICLKLDGRIVTGFEADDTVGWLWTSAQDSNHPFPYVRVATFDNDTLERVGERDIFNNAFALTMPSVGVNEDGDVGLTLYQMGGSAFPTPWATVVTNPRSFEQDLGFWIVGNSAAPPFTGEWGDYGRVFPYDNCDKTFAASTWVIRDAGNLGAEHRFLWFGREGDGCVDLAATDIVWLQNPVTDINGIQRGDALQITGVFQNSGSADSPAPSFRFYLSRNKKAGPEDTPIIQQLGLTAFAKGETKTTISLPTLPIPETFAFQDGTYYLISCIDEEHQIAEITDTNNCFVDEQRPVVISGGRLIGAIQGEPRDLSPGSAVLTGTGSTTGTASSFTNRLAPGGTFQVRETITAVGSGSNRTTPPISYRLSRAPIVDDDDVVTLASRRIGTTARSLSGRRTTFRTTRRLTLPRRIAAGRWYLVSCVAHRRGKEDIRAANDCRVRTTPIAVTGSATAPALRRARVVDRR